MKDKTIVLTGGTGNLGFFLIEELLRRKNIELVLLVRGTSQEEARNRVREIIGKKEKKTKIFQADLTKKYFGLAKSEYIELAKRTTHILHSAASTIFTLPIEEARFYNVKTTKNIINFAAECPNLFRFGFVSTAMVAGKRSGLILESEFEHKAGFKNTYEQSKYEAEALVRKNAQRLPTVIFRPPLIVTPRPSLKSKAVVNYLTLLISLVARGYLPFVPGTKNSIMNIVDGVDAARMMTRLMFKKHLSHMVYHITNGKKDPSVRVLLKTIEERVGTHIPIEYCGSMKSYLRHFRKIKKYKPEIQVAYKRTASFLPEPAYPKIFDNRNTLSELGITHVGKDPINILRSVVNSAPWNFS